METNFLSAFLAVLALVITCYIPFVLRAAVNSWKVWWTRRHLDSLTLIVVKVYSVCRSRWTFDLLHRRSALPQTCPWNGARRLQQSKQRTQSAVCFSTNAFSIAVYFSKCPICLIGWSWCRVHAILRISETLLKNTSRSTKPLLK